MMDRTSFIFGPGVEGLSPEDAARRADRSFVRSEGSLAVYKESRNPTGHRLTAWEAYTTFGLDVLEEAVEYSSAILKETATATSDALRERRKALGLRRQSVRGAAKVSDWDLETAETTAHKVDIQKLERIAFALGLDERFVAFKQDPGGDANLAYRLRMLQRERTGHAEGISAGTALLFAEASSIIRVQYRLQSWLGVPTEHHEIHPESYYGSPAWSMGYNLAERARETLGLGRAPIESLRDLAEKRLGIPVIQARLPGHIAGATVMTTADDGGDARGVVLNTVGENENVWIRRSTLAHELGHLLFDPDDRLENLRVDSYQESQRDPRAGDAVDYVEQRANAFAIAFLAPNDAVREVAPTPITEAGVATVMDTFGISHTAARYHINNCHYRNFDVPHSIIETWPSDEQVVAENFTANYFPLPDTPIQRRGRFAGLVAAAFLENLISADTGAMYLNCRIDDFCKNAKTVKSLCMG